MTRFGSFWEGLFLLLIGVVIVVVSALLNIVELKEIGKAAAFSGLGYLGGAASAKAGAGPTPNTQSK